MFIPLGHTPGQNRGKVEEAGTGTVGAGELVSGGGDPRLSTALLRGEQV